MLILTSDILHLTSDIRHLTSDIRHLLFHAAKEQLNISAYLKPYFFWQKNVFFVLNLIRVIREIRVRLKYRPSPFADFRPQRFGFQYLALVSINQQLLHQFLVHLQVHPEYLIWHGCAITFHIPHSTFHYPLALVYRLRHQVIHGVAPCLYPDYLYLPSGCTLTPTLFLKCRSSW